MLRKLLIIAILFGSVAVTYAQKKDKKKKNNENSTEVVDTANIDYKAEGAPMPDIYVHTLEGAKLTKKNFTKSGNMVVMIFNPTCDHCQTVTQTIEKNIDKFKKTDILLMSAPSMVSYLEFFNNVTLHSKYPEINVGVDSAGFINKTFVYGSLPQINIYDKNRKLIKTFMGQSTIETLAPYLE